MPILFLSMLAAGFAGLAPNPPAASDAAVIVRVEGRNQTIVVRAGEHGPTYCLESKDGRILTLPATIGELAMKHPELWQNVQTMQASSDFAGADVDVIGE